MQNNEKNKEKSKLPTFAPLKKILPHVSLTTKVVSMFLFGRIYLTHT
jgi:hypothetical protein